MHPLISTEVWEKARAAFANQDLWVAFNNTLLFVDETDIQFFSNPEDADTFVKNNIAGGEKWNVIRIDSLKELKQLVEAEVPGFVYEPEKPMPAFHEPTEYFPRHVLEKNKTIIMNNTENLEYLKNQLKFLGFDEGLYAQLESKMKEGKPEFQLNASTEYGSDKMEALISYRFSQKDGKEAYFCNNYVATLVKDQERLSQFVYVNNKGQSITFKESCNLLNGRSVYKEITPKEGPAYKAWLKIDKDNIDPRTNYPKLRSFGTNYGFDLQEAVARMPFKPLEYPDQMKTLIKSLEKGNRPSVILLKEGKEKELTVFIEANPQFKTLNMYDKNGEKMFYPMEKVAQKYGQAPTDMSRQPEQTVAAEPTQSYRKTDLLPKNGQSNGLIDKKSSKRGIKANKIS